jgi:hypothetical protein
MSKTPPLMKHQKETVGLLGREARVLDFSDPGTGKTRAHLHGFEKGTRGQVSLVVAPKTLLESAWGEDIWKFYPWLTYSIAWAHNREAAFDAPADIYLINTDGVKWLASQPKRWFSKHFGKNANLIIDESPAFKHQTSDRSKAMRKVAEYFPYRTALTGTPNSNSITDVHHQVRIIDDGKRLGTRFSSFRSAVCVPQQVGPRPEHVRWVDKPMAEQAVAGMLADITIRHRFEDCVDIPPTFERFIPYAPANNLIRMYNELEEETLIELSNGKTLSAVNAAVLRNKLLQLASGAVYLEDGSYTVVDEGRYELILDLVKERKHSLVFFSWQHQKEGLVKQAKKNKISFEVIDGKVTRKGERERITKAYQEGAYQTLFVHPETAAHGLTLTRGTTVIWASPTYRADYFKQGNHRILRKGQSQKTEIIKIQALNTIEKYVYEDVLSPKTERMVNFLSIMEKRRDERQGTKAPKTRANAA